MAHNMFFLSFLVTLVVAMHGLYAVQYVVTNNAWRTPGGVRFKNQIGFEYGKRTMKTATDFVWNLFLQNNFADRKNVATVRLFINVMDGIASPFNNIRVSAQYINGYSGNVKTEITGVIYHEITHVWQWKGNVRSTPPLGFIEGIADYVRLKAGYAPSHWVKPGQGNRWDQSYDITARFLDYCNSLRNGFVAELNKKLRNGYSANFFVELLGKNADYQSEDGNEHKEATRAEHTRAEQNHCINDIR